MTHLAVSDAAGRRYRFAERLSRGGPGSPAPRPIAITSGTTTGRRRSTIADVSTRAAGASAQAAIDLVLDEGKPPAINGVNGISQKGAQPGNASHYYSLTRMPTNGTHHHRRRALRVTGESWMDHEFGTSFLEAEQRAGTGCRCSSSTAAS